ncbi:MAG: carboxypeptidase regulatory-like domain-containing protein [Armatimonadota bacterium]
MKLHNAISRTVLVAAAMLCLMAIITPASAAVTYQQGFKWTLVGDSQWVPNDWNKAVNGYSAPATPAPSPISDSGSIADPVNAGLSSGGPGTPWNFMYDDYQSYSAVKTPLNLIVGSAGYWGYFVNSSGMRGVYKNYCPNGIGGGPLTFGAQDMAKDVWIGFQAPVDGIYSYYFGSPSLTGKTYNGSTLLSSGMLCQGTHSVRAGEFLYFTIQQNWIGVTKLYVTLDSVGIPTTLSGHVTDVGTGTGILGAQVLINPGNKVIFADADGYYSTELSEGMYDITASDNCHTAITHSNVNVSGTLVTEDFALTETTCLHNWGRDAYDYALYIYGRAPGNGLATDGTRGTSFISDILDYGWYELNWGSPVTFTKLKIYCTSEAPLLPGVGNGALMIQRWDDASQLWVDLMFVDNSSAVVAGGGNSLFELDVPGGYPVTTSRVRMVYATESSKTLRIQEFEVYNVPLNVASISGTVTDAATGVGLAYVDVSTTTGGFSTKTGPDGVYHLTVDPGTYDLAASRKFYNSGAITAVDVSAAQTVIGKNFSLTRQQQGNIAYFADPAADYAMSIHPEMSAIDGNMFTTWNSTNRDPTPDFAYYLDWGSDHTIGRVRFNDPTGNTEGWSIQTWDGANWNEIAWGMGSSTDYAVVPETGVVTTKLRVQSYSPSGPAAIDELQVFGVQGSAGMIKGTVRDQSNAPLTNARVQVANGQFVVTAGDGTYSLLAPAGLIDVTASHGLSYSTQTQSANVPTGGTLNNVDFTLTYYSPNYGQTATFWGNYTYSDSSTTYGNDGDMATFWKAWGVPADYWLGNYVCGLNWSSPITFTRMRIYMPHNYILDQDPEPGIVIEKWDDTRGVWSDYYVIGRWSSLQYTDEGQWLLDIASSVPATTSKLRCHTRGNGPFGSVQSTEISEWEVYNIPFTGSAISGVVRDTSTGNLLHHAKVTAGARETYTDSNGAYSLILDPGSYDITASRTGFTDATLTGVSLAASQNKTGVDLSMARVSSFSPDNLQVYANAYASQMIMVPGEGFRWSVNDGSSATHISGQLPDKTQSIVLDYGTAQAFDGVAIPGAWRFETWSVYSWNATTSSWTKLGEWPYSLVEGQISVNSVVFASQLTTSKLKFELVSTDPANHYPPVLGETVVSNVSLSGSDAKKADDGTMCRATDWIVTAVFGTDYYIEAPDRTQGIRVRTQYAPSLTLPVAGDEITVAGIVGTDAGERVINATGWAVSTHNNVVKPLGMVIKNIGGGDDGNDLGVTDGVGRNTLGLLIRAYGKITAIQTLGGKTTLMLNDGSSNELRVVDVTGTYSVDQGVTVTGISSVVVDGANRHRSIRPLNIF